jgi:primosomal protein N'
MSYRIAGIDVHKRMLAVVVTDVEIESEYQFERRMFSSNPEQLRSLAAWLLEQEAEEVVMESTAPILETSVGSAGKVLEADTREARRRKA